MWGQQGGGSRCGALLRQAAAGWLRSDQVQRCASHADHAAVRGIDSIAIDPLPAGNGWRGSRSKRRQYTAYREGGRCCGNVGLLHTGVAAAHQGATGSHGSELPFQLGSNAGFSNAAFRAMSAWQSVLHRTHVPAAVQVPVHVLLPWPGCRQVAPLLATHVPSEAHLWHSGQRESSHCIEREQVGRGGGSTPMGTCGEQHRVATVGHELIDSGRRHPGPRACLALSNTVATPIRHSTGGTLGGFRHIHAFVINAAAAHGRRPVC